MDTRARNKAQQPESPNEEAIASDPARRSSGVRARAQRSAPSVPPIQASQPEAAVLVSISSPADPALLEPTCAYLSAYCELCLPPQLAQRLNVAIYELYANGLRYGSSAGPVRLELSKTLRGSRLEVENRAEAAQIERLVTHVARVQADPEAAFSGEMNRFAGRSQPPPMVGLVRIAHECSLGIELQVDGDRVVLSTLCET